MRVLTCGAHVVVAADRGPAAGTAPRAGDALPPERLLQLGRERLGGDMQAGIPTRWRPPENVRPCRAALLATRGLAACQATRDSCYGLLQPLVKGTLSSGHACPCRVATPQEPGAWTPTRRYANEATA
jgi:hypothetical protein